MDEPREAYDQETENNGSCFLESGTSAVVWVSAQGKYQGRRGAYFGVQTNGWHGGRVVGIGAVTHGLSTATKTTAERTVAIRVVHRWSLVGHCRKDRS